jgi:opacity protein-like surface antigen
VTRRVPVVAVLLLLVTAAAANAQGTSGLHVGIAGGVTFPEGEAEDVFDSGWNAGALLVFQFPVVPIGIRVDGSYHKLDAAEDPGTTGDAEILAGTANLVVGFRLLLVKPYVVGGIGVYRLDFSDESFPGAFSGTNNENGWNAGAGVSFSLRKIDVFVEARYHSVATEGDRFEFVPVSVGIVF